VSTLLRVRRFLIERQQDYSDDQGNTVLDICESGFVPIDERG
jgi:hypothetical protein